MDTESISPIDQASKRKHVEPIPNLVEQPAYANSTLKAKINEQRALNPNDPIVTAFTDIDGTYIIPRRWIRGDNQQSILRRFQQATRDITQWLTNRQIPIAAVSGRDFTMIQSGQQGGPDYEAEQLPQFDVAIGAVGTEVYVLQSDGTYIKDMNFDAYLRKEIGYDRTRIEQAGIELIATTGAQHSLAFQGRDTPENVAAYQQDQHAKSHGLTTEDPPQDFKVSFNFEGTNEDAEIVRQQFRTSLAKRGYSERQPGEQYGPGKLDIVICYDRTLDESSGRLRFNLDIVPISKSGTINYINEGIGGFGIFAGDSGNDPVLEAAHAGVVVGGRKPELDMLISNTATPENTIKKTQHFTRLRIPGVTDDRILFVDPSEVRKGPESLLRAARAFGLLQAVRKKIV